MKLHVAVKKDGDGFIAINHETGIFGEGTSKRSAALKDLNLAYHDHYAVLVAAGDAITDDLRRQRDILASIIGFGMARR